MQTIFLNRYFYPDHSATSQMLSELAFVLAQTKEKIVIITSRLRYDDPAASLPPYEIINGVEIYRVYTSGFGRANLVGRSLDYLTFYLFAVLKLLVIAGRGDIVVAKTDPPLISVAVLPVIWLKRARLVNWLQDLFPEVATALGIGHGKAAPLVALLKKMRNLSLRTAKINVVLGELMAQRVRQQNIPDNKITIIANWSDGKLVQPVNHPENPLRAEWQLEERFVVGYSGNLGRAHDFEALMEAATELEESAPKVLFLFIGAGAQRQQLAKVVKERGLTNVRFKPYQPRERLSESLSASDIHIVTLKPALEGLIVPSKFYGIAAVGRPTLFIGDPQGEIPRLLEREDCGISVQPGDAKGLSENIRALAKDQTRCQAMGKRARAVFDEQFDRKIAMGKWLRLIDGLKR